ncbi:MAG: hypothetical protein NVS3B25_09640 [Hymenobacter sp.]
MKTTTSISREATVEPWKVFFYSDDNGRTHFRISNLKKSDFSEYVTLSLDEVEALLAAIAQVSGGEQ